MKKRKYEEITIRLHNNNDGTIHRGPVIEIQDVVSTNLKRGRIRINGEDLENILEYYNELKLENILKGK